LVRDQKEQGLRIRGLGELGSGRGSLGSDPVKLIIRIIGELNLRAKEKGHGDDKKSVICFALNISFRLFAADKNAVKTLAVIIIVVLFYRAG